MPICLPLQITAMSATISNIRDLATWLRAKLFEAQFRPAPLDVYVVVNGQRYLAKDISDWDVEFPSLVSVCAFHQAPSRNHTHTYKHTHSLPLRRTCSSFFS